MPSPIAHGLAAYAALVSLKPDLAKDRESNSKALGLGFAFGSLADADFLVAYYSSNPVLRHHYFSHSIPFALGLTALLYVLLKLVRFRSPGKWAGLLGVAYMTHLLLDYFTEDGSIPYGIPLFWPFTHTHYVAPLNLFYSIHRGMWHDIVGPHNLLAVFTEFAVMVPVAILAYLVARRRA